MINESISRKPSPAARSMCLRQKLEAWLEPLIRLELRSSAESQLFPFCLLPLPRRYHLRDHHREHQLRLKFATYSVDSIACCYCVCSLAWNNLALLGKANCSNSINILPTALGKKIGGEREAFGMRESNCIYPHLLSSYYRCANVAVRKHEYIYPSTHCEALCSGECSLYTCSVVGIERGAVAIAVYYIQYTLLES